MAFPSSLPQTLRMLAILSALAGLSVGCGADAPTPIKTAPDTHPSAGDDDETDESATDAGDADVADKAPSGPKTPLDAGTKPPLKTDAGSTRPAPADAGSGDANVLKPELDGSAALPDDAATKTDSAMPPSANEAGLAVPETDAAARTPDAGVPATAHVVKVDSKATWTASGFQVQTGKCYVIEAKIDDKWLDLDVPADFTGWIDKKDSRLALFTPFRRVVQDDIGFYQFATCVEKNTKHCFPVNTTSEVCPKLAGELFFFVNDVAGFETNNVGTATVTLREK